MSATAKHRPRVMTLPAYVHAYLDEPRVRLYIGAALGLSLITVFAFWGNLAVFAGIGITLLAEPFVEYVIHRFVFHSRLYRVPALADFWKHIHYDHHIDPNDPNEIFGPAEMLLPLAFTVTLPLGWLAGGLAGAAGALCTGLWVIVVYEYFHGAAHLLAMPQTRYGRWMKRIHVLHHFHNEKGNYGVTSPVCDLLFGTYYGNPSARERSPTVRNIGCTDAEAERYPWVRRPGEPKSGT